MITALLPVAAVLGAGLALVTFAIDPQPDWDVPLPPRRQPHTPRPHYPTGAGNHAWQKKQHPEGEQ